MERKAHYITKLKRTKLGKLHLAWDTETRAYRRGGRTGYRWHTAAVAPAYCTEPACTGPLPVVTHATPALLWENITNCASDVGELTMWAHNLAFDLRVSRALELLPANGFELETISLAQFGTWAAFRCGSAKLLLLDSMSWLPTSLNHICFDLGTPRRYIDYRKATSKELVERCREDAIALARAVNKVLAFLEAEHLGSLRPTGAAQSHSAWRARFMPKRSVLAHAEPHALDAERQAMWTGRTEAWRHGEFNHPLYEWDLHLAYCRIAAEMPVPGKLVGERYGLRRTEYNDLYHRGYRLLSLVTVTTELPVVPTRHEGAIVWPVGEFNTILWDPEVRALWDAGADVRLGHTLIYAATTALQDMAQWIIEGLDCESPHGPIERRLLKHWARTLVGRCGLRYRAWEHWGEHPHPDLCIAYEVDADSGEVTELLRVGRRVWQRGPETESASSVPQIPSWVMSECRVRLWRVIKLAGMSNVVYMDTDGVIVNHEGHERLNFPTNFTKRVHLAHKATYERATIYGPRNLVLDDERRIAGIPRAAIRLSELHYNGETLAGLERALADEHADAVEVRGRDWHLHIPDPRRIHLPGGGTKPHRKALNASS